MFRDPSPCFWTKEHSYHPWTQGPARLVLSTKGGANEDTGTGTAILMKTALQLITITLSLLTAGLAGAHDIWLFPERFTLAKGDTLIVHQLVGPELNAEALQSDGVQELPLLRSMTSRFELITPEGSFDLLSELPDMRTQPEVKPVLNRKLDFEGLAVVTMEHDFIYHELSGEQFLQYLEHEEFKLEAFQGHIGFRPKQRERYARYLKTLVQVAEVAKADLHKQVLGQKIEIVLLQNPYLLDPGDHLDVQVLFEGEPLRDRLVRAYNSDGTGPVWKSKARTDAGGIARFSLDRGGFWLFRLVHLRPCIERSESDVGCSFVDWESYWASYSFELD